MSVSRANGQRNEQSNIATKWRYDHRVADQLAEERRIRKLQEKVEESTGDLENAFQGDISELKELVTVLMRRILTGNEKIFNALALNERSLNALKTKVDKLEGDITELSSLQTQNNTLLQTLNETTNALLQKS